METPEATETCICPNVKNKANFMEVASGDKIHLFHKNCPDHGILLLEEVPMVEVRFRDTFSKRQLLLLGGRLHNPKLISVSPDKNTGIIEYSKWRFMTEEEKNEYHARTET